MALFVVRLSDLLPAFRAQLEEARTASGWDKVRLHSAIDRTFGFLGAFTDVRIERDPQLEFGEILSLEFNPPSNRDVAAAERLFQKTARQAESGRVREALPNLQRLVEEFPEVAKYHRSLGQAYLVLKDFDRAEDSMLRSLSLDPADPDALTLLGNLYTKRKQPAAAIPLYQRSIALQRNVYALNNLGAAYAEIGESDRAVATLREAAQVDPKYPNTWFGLGLALSRQQRLDVMPEAIKALDTCLQVIEQRVRSPEVWDAARGLQDGLIKIQASEEVGLAEKAVRRTLADIVAEGEKEVRIEEQALHGLLAKLESGWVHRRPYHRLLVTRGARPEREHHILHELEHLSLIQSAREAQTNRWFVSTAASRSTALRSMAPEIARIERSGIPHDTLIEMTNKSLEGLLGQLFNFPIDLLIETRLHGRHPELRELFFQSLKSQLEVSASIAHYKDLMVATPKQIFRANTAMNGAQALWFEERYPHRTDLVAQFQKTDAWPIARRLYTAWTVDEKSWTPGLEYGWIDNWAEILGLRDWYTWTSGNPESDEPLVPIAPNRPDEGPASSAPRLDSGKGSTGTLAPDLAKAATLFMLAAMEWADTVSADQTTMVAARAAFIGQSGIEYLDASSRYELPGYSTEPISGLHLLSVMYVLVKRLSPSLDQGIDLEAPYLAARELYQRGRGREES